MFHPTITVFKFLKPLKTCAGGHDNLSQQIFPMKIRKQKKALLDMGYLMFTNSPLNG